MIQIRDKLADGRKEKEEKILRQKYQDVQTQFILLYEKKKEEYLDQLSSGQVALLNYSQLRLRWIEQRIGGMIGNEFHRAESFRRKWAKVIFAEDTYLNEDYLFLRRRGLSRKQVLENTTAYILQGNRKVPYLAFLRWSWWRSRQTWTAEKLVKYSLIKLEKLVEMGDAREQLLIKFREEFLELFPETNKIDVHQVLWDIPEAVWRKIYRQLQLQFHPDRGGNREVTGWLVKLNEGMKNLRDWK